MRFIYTTDLHGNIEKFECIKKYALEEGIKLIHLGADLFPKGKNLHSIQKEFAKGYFSSFINEMSQKDIHVICFLGNDDLHQASCHIKHADKFHMLHDLSVKNVAKVFNYEFDCMPYVPDHPFSLKTTSRLDSSLWERPKTILEMKIKDAKDEYELLTLMMRRKASYEDFQPSELAGINDVVESRSGELIEIKDIDEYLDKFPTIKEELNKIVTRDIISIHCPPDKCKLDVTMMKEKVGSSATREWIQENQPKLVLCGHIHENYFITKTWRAMIGNTMVIQPGQGTEKTHFVDIIVGEKIQATLSII